MKLSQMEIPVNSAAFRILDTDSDSSDDSDFTSDVTNDVTSDDSESESDSDADSGDIKYIMNSSPVENLLNSARSRQTIPLSDNVDPVSSGPITTSDQSYTSDDEDYVKT